MQIYVGNLAFTATESEVRQLFEGMAPWTPSDC